MLSPAEIAALTGLSRSAIYRAIERGDLVAYKLADRLRVDVEDFEAWKRAGKVEPKATSPGPLIEPPAARSSAPLSFREQLSALQND
jgi:excisionase family DNA binding protein